jgi:hypothetical protein
VTVSAVTVSAVTVSAVTVSAVTVNAVTVNVVTISEGGQRDRPLVLDKGQLESAVGGGR